MKKYSGKVVITTHFYKHQAYLEYIHSLVATVIVLERLGIKFDYWPVSGNFHMESCFNDSLTRFMDTEDVTDLFMIDSDESWGAEHFVRLLLHEEDIVCGVYLQCNPNKKNYPVIFKTADDGSHLGKMLPDGNCLMKAERIPGGFLKVSKAALRKWADANPDEWFWFEGRKAYKFFTNEFKDNIFHGMDFTFSDKMKGIGYELWVDPIVEVKHWGITPFEGSIDAHLRLLKTNQESSGAFETIKQMAKEIEGRNG